MNKEGQLTLRLSSELSGLLAEHCEELALSKSELVRRGISHFLKHLQDGKQVRQDFLEEFARKGPDFNSIISEAIRTYIAESQAVRIESRKPTESEKNILKLEGL